MANSAFTAGVVAASGIVDASNIVNVAGFGDQ
jgi:hypothetical protein